MRTNKYINARSLRSIGGLIALGGILLGDPVSGYAGERSSDLEIIGKTQVIAASNNLDGPGSDVKGLASTFDMSLFEFNLGGRQALFNGSGITTNSNYPLTEGDSLTSNVYIGLSASLDQHNKAGFLLQLYSLLGDRTVGRVYGEELPWGDFSREKGLIEEPHFSADLYQVFFEGKKDSLVYKVVAGTLSPESLPEFSRKEMNEVKLGSLVYRAPLTNASYFTKEERKMNEGRHPIRGVDVLTDLEYAPDQHLHLELFTGATEPTPISDLERDDYGGRASLDIGPLNVGATAVYSEGIKPGVWLQEDQLVWSVDSSIKVTDQIVPYFTFAQTDYDRERVLDPKSGDAYVAGVALKDIWGMEFKGQYQRVGENYDLMAYHKIEHYPSNFEGLHFSGTLPVCDSLKIKGLVYELQQIDTEVSPEDMLFGDSFYSSAVDSDKGTISAQRLSADWMISKELSFSGYVEHAKFRKNTHAASSSTDKDVYNFFGILTFNITKELYVEGGFRHVFSVGNWQAMNFRSYQDITEAAVGYKIDKDRQATLIYHYIGFEDDQDASLGRNDYYGHQIFFEVRTLL